MRVKKIYSYSPTLCLFFFHEHSLTSNVFEFDVGHHGYILSLYVMDAIVCQL